MVDAPYQEMEPQEQSRGRRCAMWTLKVAGGVLLVYLAVVILVQAVLYYFATMNCKAGKLKDYEFPGGGAKDLVPPDSLITEQDPRWWGSAFINVPSDKEGQGTGASTGVYYRTWGPVFWTVTYQDIMSKETFVVRDRPLALGGSHKISRCDGEGPVYIVTEGTHVFMNVIRSLLGMYTSRIYNIYEDNKLVAVSSKLGGAGQSHKQMVFRKPDEDTPFASAYLKDRHFHGRFDEWFVQVDANAPLPNYVPNAVTALMAFVTASLKNHTGAPGQMLELLEELPANVEKVPTESSAMTDAEFV